jgi:hypothetical protein
MIIQVARELDDVHSDTVVLWLVPSDRRASQPDTARRPVEAPAPPLHRITKPVGNPPTVPIGSSIRVTE